MEDQFEYQSIPSDKKGLSTWKIVVIALVCGLLGGMVAVGALLADDWLEVPEREEKSYVQEGRRDKTENVKVETGKLLTPSQVYAANVNSTVGIATETTTNYWGYQTTSAASGSGFILTGDGYILTNFHVVMGSDTIKVSLFDGKTYQARLVGYDEGSDIAVLKVDAENLTPVVLGNSDDMYVGDTVVAIGNPLGELTFSLTVGAISAMNREVTLSSGVTMNLTQTDCAINSGNSGGALFNLYGEVIGVTNAKYSGTGEGASIDNIGFAIPVNDIRDMVISIIENGYVAKPYLGVSVTDVSREIQSYGIPQGAAVRSVSADSPAQKAGLQANDIITAINGAEITGRQDLSRAVSQAKPMDKWQLTVYRKGESMTLQVVLGEQIQSALPETQKK